MNRWKSSVLHEGEGNIRSVKWKGHLIAWANNMVKAPVCLSNPVQWQKLGQIERSGSEKMITHNGVMILIDTSDTDPTPQSLRKAEHFGL